MNLKVNEPMGRHTTFGIGGPAALFVEPADADEAVSVILALRHLGVPTFVLGRGSNLLVSDDGFDGAVISMSRLSDVSVNGTTIECGAGASLTKVANTAFLQSLTGFEFAQGIPGSVGGAIAMNAGAHGSCMADVIESVTVLTTDGKLAELPVDEMGFGYRRSRIGDDGMIVLRTKMRLAEVDREAIRRRMEIFMERRRNTQPIGVRSAGSTFTHPDGDFAGRLIDEAGLKGFSVGGASVSDVHAGFVVSDGTATAADVISVIRHVTDEVERQSDVRLEPEVKFLGMTA